MTKVSGRPAEARAMRTAAVAALLFCLLLAACAAAGPRGSVPPGAARIPDVPFFPQEDYQCGPAALAEALTFAGRPATPADLAPEVFRADIRGTLGLDMALAARRRGLSARFYNGSLADLAQSIRAGRPLILLLDQGLGPVSQYHFVLATGYGPDGVVMHSGRRRDHVMAWEPFLNQWGRTDQWTLWIAP